MPAVKVPEPEWDALAELGKRPEHLRTPPQMVNYAVRSWLFNEQMRLGRERRDGNK